MIKKCLALFACLFAIAPLCSDESPVESTVFDYQAYQREEVIPLLPMLNEWIANSFAPFPYLYASPEDQIVNPGDLVLVNEKNALVVVVKKEGEVVAVATGAPLDSSWVHDYFPPELYSSMEEKEIDPAEYFYVCYFLVDPAYIHDHSIVDPIYDILGDFAASLGKTKITYMDMVQDLDHPLRTDVYASPEPWGTTITGFLPMDVYVELEWPTFQANGSTAMENHVLQFHSKNL